ncbi:MAG: type VI secretion system accessory protein TagJ [Rhodocyclaceae bacterium]|nr:type VI secretion system accessory protein TagJ [Rhodocyclaceae bacterium]
MLTLTAQLQKDFSLQALLDSTTAQVKKEPSRPDLRILLFQLFCVNGAWERGVNQLATAAQLDKSAEEMARAYREVIRCEVFRSRVFKGEKMPLFLGEPEEWLARLAEALRVNALGKPEEAAVLRGEAFDAAPATAGSVDGQDFAWIADSDARLGPVLEALVNGKYYWIPFHRLSAIRLEPPSDLRDLVWLPAKLTFSTGGEQVAFIPSRYPGSETADEACRLARRTDWQDLGADTWAGLGQRMFTTDQGEYSLLDTRNIQLTAAT